MGKNTHNFMEIDDFEHIFSNEGRYNSSCEDGIGWEVLVFLTKRKEAEVKESLSSLAPTERRKRGMDKAVGNVAENISVTSYAADAAAATGETDRTIRNKTRIGNALGEFADLLEAMAVALAKPEPEKGKRNDLLNNSTGLDFDKASLSRARFVLRNCRDKAIEVLRNSKYPLTVAYEEAQAIVEKQRIAEEERQRQLAALAILREEYSDLAALVDDQRLGLPEAIAAGGLDMPLKPP